MARKSHSRKPQLRKTQKSQKLQKKQIVAFKVEDDLADFLDALPNKSEFIRKAILAQFGMTCPLCSGTGVVDKGIHDHYETVLAEHNTRPCEKCRAAVPFPMTLDAVAPKDRERLQQFLHGGPLYCSKCYSTAPPCHDCGWHVMMEKVAEHFRKVHSH
jgi:hypothetical protein